MVDDPAGGERVIVGGNSEYAGTIPRASYRDRQYGYEFSSFNRRRALPPIQLILIVAPGQYRLTTFEAALPKAFSTADFLPDALGRFLKAKAP